MRRMMQGLGDLAGSDMVLARLVARVVVPPAEADRAPLRRPAAARLSVPVLARLVRRLAWPALRGRTRAG